MKPLRNKPVHDLPDAKTRHYHDVFVTQHREEHSQTQITQLYGEHELLAFVVLSTPRFNKKLQLSTIIPHRQPGCVNIVGTISDSDSPEIVSPFIIPEQPCPLRHDPYQKVAYVAADAIKTLIDKHVFENMDWHFKDNIRTRFNMTIARLVNEGNLRVVSILNNEDFVARLDAVPVLTSNTLDSLYGRIKDDHVDGGMVSLVTSDRGGETTTTLSFSPENCGHMFIITEHSDKYVSIEHHNSRSDNPTATKSPRIVRLKLNEPSESYCNGETTIVEHGNNLGPDELLVVMIGQYPDSRILAKMCRNIRY